MSLLSKFIANANALDSSKCDSHKLYIVIPFYNVEKYLKECLDSAQAQTYKNFIAIMVDDGSSDDSALIATHYAKIDSRFILLTQKNGGVAKARNVALNYIFTALKPHKNDYIGFVDSDDMFAKDYFANLIFCLESHQLPIAKSRNIIRFNDNNPPPNQSYKTINIRFYALLHNITHNGFTSRINDKNINLRIETYRALFRAYFLESLRFCDVRLAEDVSFGILCNALAKKVAYTRTAKYFYRQREHSLMKKYNYSFEESFKNFTWLLEQFVLFNLLESYAIPLNLVKNIPQERADSHFKSLKNLIASYNFNDNILKKNPQLKAILDSTDYADFCKNLNASPKERLRQLFRLNVRKSGIHIRIFGKNIIDKFF